MASVQQKPSMVQRTRTVVMDVYNVSWHGAVAAGAHGLGPLPTRTPPWTASPPLPAVGRASCPPSSAHACA